MFWLRRAKHMELGFILFLAGIFGLGAITSYEDVKFGKIRNKWILAALAYSVILFACFWIFGDLNKEYISKAAVNSAIALLTGFGIWKIELWSAGDAKLFFVYSLLIPLGLYSIQYSTLFPSIVLLINTFIPIFIFYLTIAFFKTSWKEKKEGWIKTNSIKNMLVLFLALFSFSWIFNILKGYVDYITLFIFLFLIVILTERILKKSITAILCIIAVLRLFFDKNVYNAQFFWMFIYLFLFFLLVKYIAFGLGDFVFLKNADNKRAKMVNFDEKKKIPLKMQESLPFAPFIFAGVLLVILLNKDIISWIIEFIAKFI